MLALVVALFVGSAGPGSSAWLSAAELAGPVLRQGTTARLVAAEPSDHPGRRSGALPRHGYEPVRRRAGRMRERLGSFDRTGQCTIRSVAPGVGARWVARASGMRRRPVFAAEARGPRPEEPEPGDAPGHPELARGVSFSPALLLPSRELA